jgi:hypothetical protein
MADSRENDHTATVTTLSRHAEAVTDSDPYDSMHHSGNRTRDNDPEDSRPHTYSPHDPDSDQKDSAGRGAGASRTRVDLSDRVGHGRGPRR